MATSTQPISHDLGVCFLNTGLGDIPAYPFPTSPGGIGGQLLLFIIAKMLGVPLGPVPELLSLSGGLGVAPWDGYSNGLTVALVANGVPRKVGWGFGATMGIGIDCGRAGLGG